MKILLIDTTTPFVTVSIIENEKILYNFHEQIISDMSSKIVPIIDGALKSINLRMQDIDKIMVCDGPGSFTGIRVGVTIAKTIAWSLKKDIISISSLELISTTPTNKKFIVPMIDAKRGNVFGAIYDTNLDVIKEDKLISIKELVKGLNDDYEFVSYDNIELDELIKPNIDVLKIINKHKNDDPINPHKLNPKYLKLTEAEENLNSRR